GPGHRLRVEPCPDDDIGESVPVDVACAGDGDTEEGADLVANGCPDGRGTRTRSRSRVNIRGSFFAGGVGTRAVKLGPDDHIGEPVPVHVTRPGDRIAELAQSVTRPDGSRAGPGRRAEEYIRLPLGGDIAVQI